MFSGKLIDIINYAVELDGFWQWGSGGNIEKLPEPIHITADSLQKRKNDLEEITELTKKLEELKIKNNIK